MAGIFRLYDNFYQNMASSIFTLGTDTLKLALVADTYIPCPTYGTRGGLLNYLEGDVIYETAYKCYFVCSVPGLSSLGAPIFDTTVGAITVDGAVSWVSCGLAPPSAHNVWADVSVNETVASGYTAGGKTLTQTLTLTGGRSVLSVPQTSWDNSAITAKYAVLYKSGVAGALTNPLLGYMLLDATDGASVSSNDGLFVVRFGNDIVYRLGGW